MSAYKVRIPEPCHANWGEMTPDDKGRFCSSCQKSVYDFTKSPDREIISVLSASKNICGRFTASQMSRDLVEPKEKSTAWAIAASGVLGLLSAASAQAQEKQRPAVVLMVGDKLSEVESVQMEENLSEEIHFKGDVIIEEKPTVANFTLTGIVSDQSGPLPGAKVVLKETGTMVQTDVDGAYSIEAKSGQTIIFSFVGMETKEVQIGLSRSCDAKLEEGPALGEVIVTTAGMIAFQRPNFF